MKKDKAEEEWKKISVDLIRGGNCDERPIADHALGGSSSNTSDANKGI